MTSAAPETDLDDLAVRVMALAEINSWSFNPDGVNRCGERLAAQLESVEPDELSALDVGPTPGVDGVGRPQSTAVGRALRARKRPKAPFQVCFFGHLDTVFNPDDGFLEVTRQGEVLAGPGVADCKGGLVVAIESLRRIESAPWADQVGWEFLVVPDEEVGSIGSKPLLFEAADRTHLGIGFEPALPSGGVAAARKGSLSFHAVVSGVAAHVGRAHGDGRSAIRRLAELIVELEAANDRAGVTVNCGRISGGGALNAVPDRAVGSFNLRVETPADQTWIEARVAEAAGVGEDTPIEITWTSTRPPKVRTPELDHLLSEVTAAASSLGLTIEAEDTGGSCDGNDLAAAGLLNVDSLGIAGGGIHSPEEFADVGSIPARAAVVAEVVGRSADRQLTKGER